MSRNSYADRIRAEAYARLEFAGTYWLAYRDLPEILGRRARGRRAIDFGCGTGRSTRFLQRLGFEVIGIDISAEMLAIARARDPGGDYRLVREGDLAGLAPGAADVVLSAFTFDNVPTLERKVELLRGLASLVTEEGTLVSVVSAPEIYVNEWVSFSTRDYPENRRARSGDRVQIVITDIDDPRPVEDVVCSERDYREAFARAGLRLVETRRPLGRPEDPCEWVSEGAVPPWAIHVLERRAAP